jgi:hypothetical protein
LWRQIKSLRRVTHRLRRDTMGCMGMVPCLGRVNLMTLNEAAQVLTRVQENLRRPDYLVSIYAHASGYGVQVHRPTGDLYEGLYWIAKSSEVEKAITWVRRLKGRPVEM